MGKGKPTPTKHKEMTNHAKPGWRYDYRLGDDCSIKHGFAFKGPLMTQVDDAKLPIVVNIVNFQYTGGFRFESTKVQRYTGDFPKEYILHPGNVLLVMTCQTPKGEILGIPARVPRDRQTYLHNQRMGLVQILDETSLDLGFLYYLFLSPSFNAHLFATATGAKILHSSPSRIENYRFDCPPLSTQRKIAAILSAYDDLIENNTRRIKILEEMAQALYREWFVQFRFPGHEKVKMVASPVGPIPQGWQMVKLGSVADVNALSVKNGDEPEYINYIDISSVSPGRIDKVEHLAYRDAPGRARRIVRHGDMIWSTVRPNRRSYSLILDPLPDLIVSTGFAVMSPRDVPCSYVYHALATEEFVGYLANHARGSAYPAVNGGDFEGADFLLPGPNVLADFHNVAGNILMQCHTLMQQNVNLRRTRDLLLPKLISGEIDVSNPEIS
jgi:type I restriction enzyme S subunit